MGQDKWPWDGDGVRQSQAPWHTTASSEAVESMAFVQGLNEYGTAADVDGSVVLHVVAANDRVVPKTQSDAVKWQWGAQQVVIEGPGHELGDQGWEVSVMGPVEKFLNSL
eukprot:gene16769-30039_t